jgi:uncharacterized membrane protein
LNLRRSLLSAKQVSLVSVFAALSVVVILFLPGIPMIGLPGARITLDASIAPIYGLVIGPNLGALAALIGGLIVAGYRGWPIFSILTSFCPAVSAFVAGMLSIKNVRVAGHNLSGWTFAALTVAALIVAWYLTWVGQQAPFYPLIHWTGLIVILTFRGRISTLFERGDKKGLSLAILLSSYCGLISDHMLGNVIFILGLGSFIPLEVVSSILTSMSLPSIPALFIFMLPVSAVERLVMTLIATAFGTGVITLLRTSRLMPNAS